jgi:hypothetical protein
LWQIVDVSGQENWQGCKFCVSAPLVHVFLCTSFYQDLFWFLLVPTILIGSCLWFLPAPLILTSACNFYWGVFVVFTGTCSVYQCVQFLPGLLAISTSTFGFHWHQQFCYQGLSVLFTDTCGLYWQLHLLPRAACGGDWHLWSLLAPVTVANSVLQNLSKQLLLLQPACTLQ